MAISDYLKINDYYLYTKEDNKYLNDICIPIEKLTYNEIKHRHTLMLKINFKKISKNKYKRILRNLFKYKFKAQKKKLNIGIDSSTINQEVVDKDTSSFKIIGIILNYNKQDNDEKNFVEGIKAVFLSTYKDTYEYAYDNACEYFDKIFYQNNFCDFHNDKCGEKICTASTWGCCRHYKIKFLGPALIYNPFMICEYLKDKKCSAKCLPCKFYTCDYIEKKGVTFHIKDFLLLTAFFNPFQQYTLRYKVYCTKEQILETLYRERILGLF